MLEKKYDLLFFPFSFSSFSSFSSFFFFFWSQFPVSTLCVPLSRKKGEIIIEMHREWSPEGVDRVYELVKLGFCDTTETSRGLAFFRVVPNFVVQFGIHGDPSISSYWRNQHIPDDPVVESNLEGYLTFASAGPNTRTSQLFFNLVNNPFLDKSGFSPLGKIVSGLETLRQINSQYKEKPNQGQLQTTGQEYLDASFPNLDYITRCSIQEEP
eukprot:m.107820 g.107820  ORF g.107820 m.107820 type:complete len:212 (+) comp9181_c0_seq6:377-1012(+)